MALTNLKAPFPSSMLTAITNLFNNIFISKGLLYVDNIVTPASAVTTATLDKRSGKIMFNGVTVNANTTQTFTINTIEALENRMTISVIQNYQSETFVIQRCQTLDGSVEVDIRNITGSNYTGDLSVQFMITG